MKTYNLRAFRECEICAAKPGSPTLCQSCLNNRSALEDRDVMIGDLRRKMEIISLVIE